MWEGGQVAGGLDGSRTQARAEDRGRYPRGLFFGVRFGGLDMSGALASPALDLGNRIITAERSIQISILRELRVISYLLATGMNVRDDLDGLRREPRLAADTDASELEN